MRTQEQAHNQSASPVMTKMHFASRFVISEHRGSALNWLHPRRKVLRRPRLEELRGNRAARYDRLTVSSSRFLTANRRQRCFTCIRKA